MPLDFVQVDAFTRRPLRGNPAAVVFGADDVSTETMQRIAQEMNLSETVFVLRPSVPEADYRARIFTPRSEMPFAGHPTVAAAHAVLERFPAKAGATLLRQECGIGLVPVEVIPHNGGRLLRMTQGRPAHRAAALERAALAALLGCAEADLAPRPAEVVSTGVQWLVVELGCFEAISKLRPDLGAIEGACRALGAAGITVFAERPDGDPNKARVRVRTFAPGEGIVEDPVCGSGNGSVAAYVARHKHPQKTEGSYLAEQGVEIGRDGEVHVSWRRDGDALQVRVGGEAAVAARGQLYIE